jgi:hypothetical protein
LRPRNEFVRFAKTAALAMRNVNTGNPDAVQVSVRGQHTDGRYIVRRDHWPMDILVPSSPRDAVIPFPRRMPMGFEDGQAQKPVLYWLQRREREILGPLGSTPIALTLNWSYWRADQARTNSWTDSAFNWTTAAIRTGYSGARLYTRAEELEPDGGPGYYPNHSIGTATAVTSEDTGGSFDSAAIEDLFDDATIPYDFVGFGSMCRDGGWLYAELLAYVEDGPDNLEYRYCAKFNAAYLTGGLLDLEWIKPIGDASADPERTRMDGTDLLVINVGDELDPIKRVVAIAHSPDMGEIYVTHIDDATGEDLVEDIFDGYDDPSIGLGTILADALTDDRPRTRCVGDTIWISASGAIHCVQVFEAGTVLLWTTDDREDVDQLNFHPLMVVGSRLLVAWEGEILRETITDNFLSIEPATFGDSAPEDREIQASGTSYLGGTMALNATTGAEISRRYSEEDPVTTDTAEGPQTHHLHQPAELTYEAPDRPLDSMGDPEPDGSIYTGFGELKIPRAYVWFWHEGFEYDPMTDNPIDLTPAAAATPPNNSTATGIAWHVAQNARIEAHQDLMATRFDAMAASRPVTTGAAASGIVADYCQVKTNLVSTADADLGEVTWTDVRGPLAPPSLDYDDQYLLNQFESGSPAPFFPRFPVDETDATTSPASDFWDDYHADPDTWLGVGARPLSRGPVGGATYTINQAVIWLERGEDLERARSGSPGWAIGRQCLAGNLVVSGPAAREVESGVWAPLKWQALTASNTVAWSYTHPSTGGATFCDAGTPVAVTLSDSTLAVITFVVIGTSWKAICLNALTGELIDSPITSPTSMAAAMFDGAHFLRDDGGGRFGPA